MLQFFVALAGVVLSHLLLILIERIVLDVLAIVSAGRLALKNTKARKLHRILYLVLFVEFFGKEA